MDLPEKILSGLIPTTRSPETSAVFHHCLPTLGSRVPSLLPLGWGSPLPGFLYGNKSGFPITQFPVAQVATTT